MAPVHDQVFGARTPTYATILQLDRKLRAYQVPPALQIAGFGGTSSEPNTGSYPQAESIPLMLQRHIVLAIREMSLCPLPLVSLPFTDGLARFVIYAPRLLCARIKRPSEGPSRQSLWNIRHCCLQERRIINSVDAELALATPTADGKNVVPLDSHVLLRGTSNYRILSH